MYCRTNLTKYVYSRYLFITLSHASSIYDTSKSFGLQNLYSYIILQFSDTWQLLCTHYGNTTRDGDVTRERSSSTVAMFCGHGTSCCDSTIGLGRSLK